MTWAEEIIGMAPNWDNIEAIGQLPWRQPFDPPSLDLIEADVPRLAFWTPAIPVRQKRLETPTARESTYNLVAIPLVLPLVAHEEKTTPDGPAPTGLRCQLSERRRIDSFLLGATV